MRLAAVLCLSSSLLLAQQSTRYELSFPNAVHHEAQIQVTFNGVPSPVLEVVMSRSSPGRYALHEFAKNVYNVKARDGQGHPLTVTRPDPYQWNISGHKGTVVLEYTLFGDRADGTYAAIDPTHAHLNLPATLMWAHGFEKSPSVLRFQLPAGRKWRIATQLAQQDDTTFTAPSLDMLMDSPVEAAELQMPEWSVGDRKFRLALHHTGTQAEADAYARMCQALVTEEEGVFGAFPKYDNGAYTFLVDYLPYASGDGMEHRNSTVVSGTRALKDHAADNIGTVSHEFFHSWNVERIRPQGLEPFNFERANMSDSLWFAEGFTSYYTPLELKRAGLWSSDRFQQSIGSAVSFVLNSPGREVFDVTDMSRQAPFVDAASSIDPKNTMNTFISYYTYGTVLGLGIDLSIRDRFPGKSLDDWMRTMWKEHPDVQKPYTLEELQSALARTTSKEFADEIFSKYIRDKQQMDYAALLEKAGFVLRKADEKKAWLDLTRFLFAFGERGAEVNGSTMRGSPLYNAGIDRGDVITSFEGKSFKSSKEFDSWLESHKPGDTVKLQVEGRAGKRDVPVTLTGASGLEMVAFEQAGRKLSAEQLAFRKAWLSSKAVHPLPGLHKYCVQCKRELTFEYDHCPYDGKDLSVVPVAESK